MSPDPNNAFFADGISEEILNVLAGIDGLKVASRTSAFSFRDTNTPLDSIAAQLGVAHVLEGSVRKQGNEVRITAQLIDAKTDAHLWSESFDRQLDDVFAVQEEIAQAITQSLGETLGVRKVSVTRVTDNLQAYEQYLRGRTLFYRRNASLTPARSTLESTVEEDPEFAEAWAFLSATYTVMDGYRGTNDISESAQELGELARNAAERALELDDSLALPYAVLGQLSDDVLDRPEAERLFSEALRRDPDNLTALLWRGLFYQRVGHFERSRRDLQRAVTLDPLIGINNAKLGYTLAMMGDIEEGYALMERGYAYGYLESIIWMAVVDVHRNDLERAEQNTRRYADIGDDPLWRMAYTLVADSLEDSSKRPELFQFVLENPELTDRYSDFIGELALVGFYDEAMEAALTPELLAYSQAFPMEMWMPALRNVVDDPRFMTLATHWRMNEYWEVRGYPDGCELATAPEPHLECDW